MSGTEKMTHTIEEGMPGTGKNYAETCTREKLRRVEEMTNTIEEGMPGTGKNYAETDKNYAKTETDTEEILRRILSRKTCRVPEKIMPRPTKITPRPRKITPRPIKLRRDRGKYPETCKIMPGTEENYAGSRR
jgi:arsenate reductase-like glutaredoxin family protein